MKYDYSCYVDKNPMRIEDINIFSVSRDRGYRYSFSEGRHCHAFIYTDRGRILNEFKSPRAENIITESGTLMFIPKGTVYHATYLDEGTFLKTVQFNVSGELPEYLTSPRIIDLDNTRSIINSFFSSIENTKSNNMYHFLALVYDLLWQVDTRYFQLPKKFARLSAALEDLSLYPEKNEKISYYADMCYMSEGNFRRLFHEHIGTSPIEYRNSLRLEKARTLLQSGEYNVSEAALAVGFSNLPFFIRLYKKKFGITPKKEA